MQPSKGPQIPARQGNSVCIPCLGYLSGFGKDFALFWRLGGYSGWLFGANVVPFRWKVRISGPLQADPTNIALFEIDYYDDPESIEDRDELEFYLLERVTMVTEPISWWKEHQHRFPQLSRMALEFLSIPAMSDEVERVLSGTKLIQGLTRAGMGDPMVSMLQCLKSWA